MRGLARPGPARDEDVLTLHNRGFQNLGKFLRECADADEVFTAFAVLPARERLRDCPLGCDAIH